MTGSLECKTAKKRGGILLGQDENKTTLMAMVEQYCSSQFYCYPQRLEFLLKIPTTKIKKVMLERVTTTTKNYRKETLAIRHQMMFSS